MKIWPESHITEFTPSSKQISILDDKIHEKLRGSIKNLKRIQIKIKEFQIKLKPIDFCYLPGQVLLRVNLGRQVVPVALIKTNSNKNKRISNKIKTDCFW